jgi:hypothetical protein
MVRNYQRTSDRQAGYDKEKLKQAVEAVECGMKLLQAEKEFGIPRNTIRRHRERKIPTPGAQPVFTRELENVLEERIVYMCERGFPCTIEDLRIVAHRFAKKMSRRKKIECYPSSWDREGKASYDWWYSFKSRHPSLSLRVSQNLSTSRAEAFNMERVSTFFNDMNKLYADFNFNQFPQLIYNCDETGLSNVPNNTKKVLARKGAKIVHKLQMGERGTLTTLMPCVNAVGDILPPFLIFKGSFCPQQTNFPDNSTICCSKSGYIDKDIFLVFLEHFQKHRVKIHNQKALLIMDGHSSHLSVDAIEFALVNDIELACIPPHTSHRLQPLDTNFNGPLKKVWSHAVSEHLRDNEYVILSKLDFAKVFSKVWINVSKERGNIVNAFSHCGLYPLKNVTSDKDFKICRIFENNHNDIPIETRQSGIRTCCPTPKKEPNKTHKKRHLPHITSPSHPKYLRLHTEPSAHEAGTKPVEDQSDDSNADESTAPSTSILPEFAAHVPLTKPCPSIKRRTQSTAPSTSILPEFAAHVPLTKPCPSIKRRTQSTAPSTSTCPKNAVSGSSRLQKTRYQFYTNSNSYSCCVCYSQWNDADSEWYRCTKCLNWACEECFAVDTCANCC